MALGSWGSRDIFIAPSCSWLSRLHRWKCCSPPPNNPGLSPPTPLSWRFLPPSSLAQPVESTLQFSVSMAQVVPVCFFTHHPIKFQMLNCGWWGWQALLPLHSSLGHWTRKAVTTANPSRSFCSENRQRPRSPPFPCWPLNPACVASVLLLKEYQWHPLALNKLTGSGFFLQMLTASPPLCPMCPTLSLY